MAAGRPSMHTLTHTLTHTLANTRLCTHPRCSLQAADHVGFPAVIKPIHGAASLGVLRVNSRESLSDAYSKVRRQGCVRRGRARGVPRSCGLIVGALCWGLAAITVGPATQSECPPLHGRHATTTVGVRGAGCDHHRKRRGAAGHGRRAGHRQGEPGAAACADSCAGGRAPLSAWRSWLPADPCALAPPCSDPPPAPCAALQSSGLNAAVLMEEYLDGPEVDVDLVFSAGEPVYGAGAHRLCRVRLQLGAAPRRAAACAARTTVRALGGVRLRPPAPAAAPRAVTRCHRRRPRPCRRGDGQLAHPRAILQRDGWVGWELVLRAAACSDQVGFA